MKTICQPDVCVHELNFEFFIDQEDIAMTIRQMAMALDRDFVDRKPVFISILNGAFVFAADLLRTMESDVEIHFIKLASYEGVRSSGEVLEMIGLHVDVRSRPVVIIEDIIDTGKTLHTFVRQLREKQPASIDIAALFVKPEAIVHPIEIAYTGLEIPNDFVVGFGLDYNGLGRGLKHLYRLKPS